MLKRGHLGKRISDQQWRDTVLPSLRGLLPELAKYDEAVLGDSWEEQISAIESIEATLPAAISLIKSTPNPSSNEVRGAKKDLEWALKRYARAMSEGEKVINPATRPHSCLEFEDWQRAEKRASLLVWSYKTSVHTASDRLGRATGYLNEG